MPRSHAMYHATRTSNAGTKHAKRLHGAYGDAEIKMSLMPARFSTRSVACDVRNTLDLRYRRAYAV